MKKWSQGKKNEGSTFLLVVIAMVFIAALGITILTIAVNNFQMITIDQTSKSNFYDTEGILAEIKMGTAEVAGEVYKEVYPEIMAKFRELSMTPGADPKTLYECRYLGRLAKRFALGSPVGIEDWDGTIRREETYDLDVLRKCTKDETAIVTADTESVLVLDEAATPKTLTLQNVKVRITTASGYDTLVSTDLEFKAPDLGFDIGTYPEYANYALIGNERIDLTSGNNLQITGNVYSGPEGFHASNVTGVSIESQNFISRGNLSVYSNTELSIKGNGTNKADIWVEDIKTVQTPLLEGEAVLNLEADCFVSDDMELNARNSRVSLKGDYRGYNFNKENALSLTNPEKSNTLARYSSSILVNGMDCLLDMQNVDSILLAGRAFVGRDDRESSGAVDDILTSESIAVKSNQVAYLVPLEYIDTGTNPSSKTQVEAEKRRDPMTGLMTVVHFSDTDPVWPYLDETKPYTEYHYQGLDGEVYVYYFMNFRDDEMANRYMRDYYYKRNEDALKNRAGMYLLKSNSMFGFSNWKAVGLIFNYPYGLQDGEDGRQDFGASQMDEDTLNNCIGLARDYMSLQKTLLKNNALDFRWGDDLDGNPDKTVDPLFDHIVDSVAMAELGGTVINQTVPLKDGTTAQLYITNADCTIGMDTDDKGLVIAGGDVRVSNDFEGLIVSKKAIDVGSVTSIKANEGMVREIIEWAARNGYAKYYVGVNEQSEVEQDEDADAIAASIAYRKWKKNEF